MNPKKSTTMKTNFLMKTMSFFAAFTLFSVFSLMAQIVEVRETTDIDGVKAGGVFKIEFTQGDEFFLELEGREEHLADVNTRVSNGVLELEYDGRRRNPEILARVTAPELRLVELSGASSFKALTIIHSPALEIILSGATSATLSVEVDQLNSQVSGAATLFIDGEAVNHKSRVSGASQLRALDLKTNSTDVSASGASHARIWAEQHVKANASGTSRVSYDVAPQTEEIQTSGMSSVNGARANDMSFSTGRDGDTTRISLGGRDFMIVDDEEGKRTRVQRSSRRSFRNNWSGFELGINGYLTPNNDLNLSGDAELIDLRYEKSVAVNINFFQQSFPLITRNFGFYTGVGLGFNNYRFDNQTRIVHNRDGLEFYEDSVGTISKNKLTLTYINIPAMFEFQTGASKRSERFHIGAGAMLGTRIGTHTKYVYDDDGKKRKEKDYNNFHVPPFRFDLMGRIGWGRVNLFATYSLNSLFKEDKGPELYPFTVGIRLLNW